MNIGRMYGLFLRHFFLITRSFPRILDLIYWPTIQITLWGFISNFFTTYSSYYNNAVGIILTCAILYDFLFRTSIGFNMLFLEEIWSRNFTNLFIAPLKLKEISYIHAEAYAAGELKHGPLALIDENMPIIAIAPNDDLVNKLKNNLEEVKARGGKLFIIADQGFELQEDSCTKIITLGDHAGFLSPILHVIPLQLLAYHVANSKGNDVDKPRNLAKSVTVE